LTLSLSLLVRDEEQREQRELAKETLQKEVVRLQRMLLVSRGERETILTGASLSLGSRSLLFPKMLQSRCQGAEDRAGMLEEELSFTSERLEDLEREKKKLERERDQYSVAAYQHSQLSREVEELQVVLEEERRQKLFLETQLADSVAQKRLLTPPRGGEWDTGAVDFEGETILSVLSSADLVHGGVSSQLLSPVRGIDSTPTNRARSTTGLTKTTMDEPRSSKNISANSPDLLAALLQPTPER
jgi:hypothetical protein